ncbi:MAG: mutL [Candidatus Paceibacter sp.]|jgi:DNA mismatch repair protein MutL|nr:mutL [Candidatus Paceibacter sp.]
MPTIKKLSTEIVSRIAAGEVAERPATIIKELIENSLDAQAQHIDIVLEQGGIKSIVVKDDGIGMSYDDLMMCYLPHTTSKIFTIDDLYQIGTFGFRGEALGSIAAVSVLTIKSRTRDEEKGYMIELEQGVMTDDGAIGMPEGTEIKVESLFADTPARRKFLKEPKHELRAINEVMIHFALAFPHISFSLTNDGTRLIHLPAEQNLSQRIHELISPEVGLNIIPVSNESRYGKISGLVGKPQTASKIAHHYIFVNNRPISNIELSKYITEAYGSLIEPRMYIPHIIFLELPFDTVDVNIHPRKEEVIFAYNGEVKYLVGEGVRQALQTHDLTYRDPKPESNKAKMDTTTANTLKELVQPWFPNELSADKIMQVDNVYLIAPTKNGIIIADQHAAHERILFEQFREAYMTAPLTQYTLPEPLIIELSLAETLLMEEHLNTFEHLGFTIELFGPRVFKLSVVPEILKDRDHKKHILEVLHDASEIGKLKDIDRETERTLSFLACRSAIKAGDPLSADERKRLIEKMLEAKTPYTCPHGRPTHIEISFNELDRMFKRK